jgi:hypothetical protein
MCCAFSGLRSDIVAMFYGECVYLDGIYAESNTSGHEMSALDLLNGSRMFTIQLCCAWAVFRAVWSGLGGSRLRCIVLLVVSVRATVFDLYAVKRALESNVK